MSGIERKTDGQGGRKTQRLTQPPPNFLQRVEQAHLKDLDSFTEHTVQQGKISGPEEKVHDSGVVEGEPRGLDRAEVRAGTENPALGGTMVSGAPVLDSAEKGTKSADLTSDMVQDFSSGVGEAILGEGLLNASTRSDPKLTPYYLIAMLLIGAGLGIVVGTAVAMSLFP